MAVAASSFGPPTTFPTTHANDDTAALASLPRATGTFASSVGGCSSDHLGFGGHLLYLCAVSHRPEGDFAYYQNSRYLCPSHLLPVLCHKDARLKGDSLTAKNNPAAV